MSWVPSLWGALPTRCLASVVCQALTSLSAGGGKALENGDRLRLHIWMGHKGRSSSTGLCTPRCGRGRGTQGRDWAPFPNNRCPSKARGMTWRRRGVSRSLQQKPVVTLGCCGEDRVGKPWSVARKGLALHPQVGPSGSLGFNLALSPETAQRSCEGRCLKKWSQRVPLGEGV